jgi:hypothetical protein
MGMFTNDILFGGKRLDQEFRIGSLPDAATYDPGENFILLDCRVLPDKVPTSIGDAEKTVLTVCKLDPETNLPVGDQFDVGTLSQAIAAKAKEKAEGDLPAVVRCHMAQASESGYNDALVMTFVSSYDGPPIEHGGALDVPATTQGKAKAAK